MADFPEGRAVIYCEGALGTTTGKTAHGLVRRSHRYHVVAVIDSTRAGADAGQLLNGRPNGIPVVADTRAAPPATHFVIGLAPDGGRLDAPGRDAVRSAVESGLHVVSGLHDFLGDDPRL